MSLHNNKMTLSYQRGIASLLMMIMIGLSLTAAMVGSSRQLRSAQEQSVSMHAQTQAQARAWAAAEAFRHYLQNWRQSESSWNEFVTRLETVLDEANGAGVTVNIGMSGVQAKIVSLQTLTTRLSEGGVPHITLLITASVAASTPAESSSTLEVVYAGAKPVDAAQGINPGVINFQGDLTLTGGIEVFGEQDESGESVPYEINVIGDITIMNTKIDGVDVIRSTGSVDFTGSISWFKEIYANCDVKLVSSGSAEIIHATHNICIQNTSNEYKDEFADPSVLANGSIDIWGGDYRRVYALAGKNETALRCADNAKSVCSPSVEGISLNPTPKIENLKTRGDLVVNSSATVTQGAVEGDLQFVSGLKGEIIYGGELVAPEVMPEVTVSKIDDYKVDITPAAEVTLNREIFTVTDLKAHANYLFFVDEQKFLRVQIKDIAKIPDQIYYLVNTTLNNQPFNDWACVTPTPTRSEDCVGKIGHGYSDYNRAITYDTASRTWSLEGLGFAPGVVYFEGNVSIKGGDYYNTFLATGDVSSSGSTIVYAPNYAGEKGGTYANGEVPRVIPAGVCKHNLSILVPTQFCKEEGFDYSVANGLGNFAVKAGECLVKSCEQYSGGDIKTYAYAQYFGAIKAGNQFVTSGNSRVDGYITALGLRTSAPHAWTAKTSVDLRNLPPGYDPSGNKPPASGGNPATSVDTEIRWSRYL
ncbi:MAG: hypothetical protein ACI4NJ_11340 [Cellvibrio sp.]